MFDLISGGPRHPFHDRTAAPVVVSVVGHAAVITLVLVVPLFYAGAIPSVPTMMAFVADAPVPPAPPPPLPPPPPARPAGKTVASRPQATTSGAFAAPLEAPSEIRPDPPGTAINYGGEGGVEGGIEGGVAGGIVVGLV